MTSEAAPHARDEPGAAGAGAVGRTAAGAGRAIRRQSALRVLIVSHAFPPLNAIGSVRVGKFAKYLHEAGHDVRVVAAPGEGDLSLPVEIPLERVVYQAGWQLDRAFDGVVRLIRRLLADTGGGKAAGTEPSAPSRPGVFAALTRHYYALLRIPDARAGWIGAATRAGRGIARDWRPDIVFASAPPNSAFLAARRIARTCGVPWVAELRDLWIDNSFYDDPRWRLWVDRLIEPWVLNSAAGLVTVSQGWAENLRRRYHQPIACVFNGFAAEDFPAPRPKPPAGDVVSIVYSGNVHLAYREPIGALFRAIGMLGAERDRVAVNFYGSSREQVEPLAAAYRVSDRVFVHPRVPYKEFLALQSSADVLLLVQQTPTRDAANIPGKLFEYFGARRPILLLGYEHGEPAAMIRGRGAGCVANDPSAIASQLRRWIAQRPSGIPAVDPKAAEGLSRAEQFFKLERFLTETVLPEWTARGSRLPSG